MARKAWAFDPHSGGNAIPERVKLNTKARLETHGVKHYAGKYERLEVRFRGALCYIDAYKEPTKELMDYWRKSGMDVQDAIGQYRKRPTHLGRLRYFDVNRWSYAFYTYSNERYEPTIFPSGDFFGTPEEAFDIGARYLHN